MQGVADVSSDSLKIGNFELQSRLIVGTGKYKTFQLMEQALEASGARKLRPITGNCKRPTPARRPAPPLPSVEIAILSEGERRDAAADLHFRRQVSHLHALGPRATAELLEEIGAQRMIRTFIDQKLARYAAIHSVALCAAGGDRPAPVPLHRVQP